MARSAILGNGTIAVGIDENGLVHDFYFPYVGLENLNNARIDPHYIGVFINGTFSWIHEDNWEKSILLADDSMAVDSTYTNESLGIALTMKSYVDAEYMSLYGMYKSKTSQTIRWKFECSSTRCSKLAAMDVLTQLCTFPTGTTCSTIRASHQSS